MFYDWLPLKKGLLIVNLPLAIFFVTYFHVFYVVHITVYKSYGHQPVHVTSLLIVKVQMLALDTSVRILFYNRQF